MKKAAVILAPGFEEGEALNVIDILRRAGVDCESVSLSGKQVTGSHKITVLCDRELAADVSGYDMIVLPGGLPGAENLRDSSLLMDVVREMDKAGRFVCAICAAPIALERAGVLEGRTWTAYPGYDQKIKAGTFSGDEVVVDGNVITSRGPATVFAFAYRLGGAMCRSLRRKCCIILQWANDLRQAARGVLKRDGHGKEGVYQQCDRLLYPGTHGGYEGFGY